MARLSHLVDLALLAWRRQYRRLVSTLTLVLGCTPGPRYLSPGLDPRTPVPTAVCADPAVRPRFAFRTSFWLNLHNFLHKEAKRRSAIDDDGPGAGGNIAADTIGERALASDEGYTWRRALEFFQDSMLGGRSRDSVVTRIDDRIADVADSAAPRLPREESSLQGVLTEAAAVYRAVWWGRHARRNREWVRTMEGLLERYLGCLAPRVAEVFQSEWPPMPIRVDASVYANWFGAYSTSVAGPRVTVSSNAVGNLELYGLETLLHEAVHAGRMLRSVDSALATEAASQGRRVPEELSHLLLFYTAGALVRAVVPTHVPYAERFGIWARNEVAQRLHVVIATEWGTYLSGEQSFEGAIRGLVARIGAPSS